MTERVGIRLESVSVRFGETLALDDVSLDILPGEFFSLLGPSGCGKTTLLRVIGGFEKPQSGSVFVGGDDVTAAPPQERPTAMVFQSYALFPSMSVFDNVAYGLRLRGVRKTDAAKTVGAALARVGLEGLEGRDVTALSGGQQQRVALARAIAIEPKVLLFDEPLSNLDVALRERTRRELRDVQRQVGHTSVYVTHDQQEALGLSDRIAVMRSGRVVQIGTPEELYAKPSTAYVAAFLGGASIIGDPESMVRLSGGSRGPAGTVLAVRPASVRQSSEGLAATVCSHQFLGDYREVLLEAHDGTEIKAHWTVPVEVGAAVRIETSDPKWVAPD
jgi:ABC-type Fe3+/spermidine/putrescine transport system ATPase subunit